MKLIKTLTIAAIALMASSGALAKHGVHNKTTVDDITGTSSQVISWSHMRVLGVPDTVGVSYMKKVVDGVVKEDKLYALYGIVAAAGNPQQMEVSLKSKHGSLEGTALKIKHATCNQYGCSSTYYVELSDDVQDLVDLLGPDKKAKVAIYRDNEQLYAYWKKIKLKEVKELVKQLNKEAK